MDRSLAATLGIAVIAHAIAFAFVRPRPSAMRQPIAASVAADSQDVIELTDEPIAPAAQPTTPGITPIASEPTKVAVVAKGAPKDVVAIEIPSAPASSGGVEIVAPAGSGSEPPAKSASKIPSLINLDSPGSHAVIFPAGSGSTDTPASKEIATAKKLDAQLKAAMDAKDTEVGSGLLVCVPDRRGAPITAPHDLRINLGALSGDRQHLRHSLIPRLVVGKIQLAVGQVRILDVLCMPPKAPGDALHS